MTNAPKDISTRHVTDHFSSWGSHQTGSPLGDLHAGFVDWAWDARPETLSALNGDVDTDQLVDDIAYSLRQCDEFRTADQADVDRASRDFLEECRDELICALQASLVN